jgi:outer membrane biosynthesis protein TonB
VRFDIQPTGDFQVTLESSSGNAEIDKIVVAGLKTWKWRPQYKDGNPVATTLHETYTFEGRN